MSSAAKVGEIKKLNRGSKNDVDADDEGNSFFDEARARNKKNPGRKTQDDIKKRESRALLGGEAKEFNKVNKRVDESDDTKKDCNPFRDLVRPNYKADTDAKKRDGTDDFI